MSFNYTNIPQEIKATKQWVARCGKMPINAVTLNGASSTNSAHWTTFENASNAIGKTAQWYDGKTKQKISGTVDGIGFVLSPPYCGIDLDHVINADTGEITPEAADIIRTMDSYTEKSPSGTGIHIIYKGELHRDWKSKIHLSAHTDLEMYQQGRYFTVTGNKFTENTAVEEREPFAQAVYNCYFEEAKERTPKTSETSLIRPLPPLSTMELSDQDIIDKAAKAKNGGNFTSLYGGDTSAYNNDESAADLALCNLIAFYTSDSEQIDRIFRSSGLMRDKWDRKTGSTTYGRLTIEKALTAITTHYNPGCYRTAAIQNFQSTISGVAPPEKAKEIAELLTYETVRKYKADHMRAAELFADCVKSVVCYIPEYKAFYVYNGCFWKSDKQEALETNKLLMKFVEAAQAIIPPRPPGEPKEWSDEEAAAEKINKTYRELFNSLTHRAPREQLLKDCRSYLQKPLHLFDKDPYLLNVQNGTYNLETGELQPHRCEDYISMCANVEYNPNAKYPRFDKFIDEITEGKTDRAEALQRSLGYALKGEANEECLFLAHGATTRNGKGTLFDTVKNLLGNYAIQMDFATIARMSSKDGSRATPDVARLNGKRFVLSNEPDKGSCFNEAFIKQLTGNDDVTARPLYGDTFEFKPVFTLFISANDMPTITDNSLFDSDRVKVLPFNKHFTEEERDTTLKSKLRHENAKSAILNWLIAGYKKYKNSGGLINTDEMKQLVNDYRENNDTIQAFIDERLQPGDPNNIHSKKTRFSEVLSHYKIWCENSNIRRPLGRNALKQELQRHGIEFVSVHKQWCIIGTIKPISNDFC